MRVSLILLAALAAAPAAAAPMPSASELARKIAAVGAQRAAHDLSEPAFDVVLRHAATGDAQWLDAVADLRGGTDGGRSEGIDLALSTALQTNPGEVLALVASHPDLRVDWLCEDRAIEPSAAADRRFTLRATRAVRAVATPALVPLRDQCLAALARRAPADRRRA